MLVVKQGAELDVTSEALTPLATPPIVPMSAPAFVPPTDPIIPPNPLTAPAPSYQFRGEGGTPFMARPSVYLYPLTITEPSKDYTRDLSGYGAMPDRNKDAVPANPVLPGRPGEDQTMPVPTGQRPAKPMVLPPVQPVQPPPPAPVPATGGGPVTGVVAGFDLSRVPFWAWLAVAALAGSRLLK